jgi:hypothetical protein
MHGAYTPQRHRTHVFIRKRVREPRRRLPGPCCKSSTRIACWYAAYVFIRAPDFAVCQLASGDHRQRRLLPCSSSVRELLFQDLSLEYRNSHGKLLQYFDGHLERASIVIDAGAWGGTACSHSGSVDIHRVDLFAASILPAPGLVPQSRPSFSALFSADLTTLAIADGP